MADMRSPRVNRRFAVFQPAVLFYCSTEVLKSNTDYGCDLHFRTIDFGRQDHSEPSTSGWPEVDGSKPSWRPKSMNRSDSRLRTTEVDAVRYNK